MFEQFVKELGYLKNVSPLTIRNYRQAHDRYLKYGQETLPMLLIRKEIHIIFSFKMPERKRLNSLDSHRSLCAWVTSRQ